MKTSAIIVAAAAALASAQAPPEGTNTVNCAKPNAAYCLGGDIILRCDANKIGTAGRCSNNVAGYPPMGGVAECYQSGPEVGDAACQKNCVVYAQPSFTLPASQCTPSFTASATAAPTTLQTSGGPVYVTTIVNGTQTLTVPCSTSPAPHTSHSHTKTGSHTGTGSYTHRPTTAPAGGNSTAGPTKTPIPPSGTTSAPTTVPTAGAATHGAAGALALVGIVAALFI